MDDALSCLCLSSLFLRKDERDDPADGHIGVDCLAEDRGGDALEYPVADEGSYDDGSVGIEPTHTHGFG